MPETPCFQGGWLLARVPDIPFWGGGALLFFQKSSTGTRLSASPYWIKACFLLARVPEVFRKLPVIGQLPLARVPEGGPRRQDRPFLQKEPGFDLAYARNPEYFSTNVLGNVGFKPVLRLF